MAKGNNKSAKADKSTLKKISFSRRGALVFGLIFVAVGGYLIFKSFAATPTAANIWVNVAAGASPSRCATACAYNASHAYGDLSSAYDAAQPGDTVLVQCGSYDGFDPATALSNGPNITFQPVTDFCASIGNTDGSMIFRDHSGGNATGSYSTWQKFVMPGGTYEEATSSYLRNLVLDHNHIAVDQQATGTINNFHLVNGLQFINNTVGPACCSQNQSSPEGLRIGTPGGGSSTNVLVKGNLIQYPLRTCSYWPSTYKLEGQTLSAGSCPGTTCTGCHDDGMHVWGLTNSTIQDNRIVGAEVQGIFIENSNGVNGLTNANNNIIDNMVSVVGGNAGIYVEGNGTSPLISGTWNIAFNTTPNLIEIASYNGMAAGTVFNLTGNVGQLMNASSGGNNAGCQGQASGVTINYKYNAWLPTNGGTSGPCGAGDLGNANVAFVDAISDLDLANGNTQANNLVPAATCTAIITSDINGNGRPAAGGSACDAGADEYGATAGGGTTPKPGDVNGDGSVNVFDLSILLTNYGKAGNSSQGDLNNDNQINVFDLSILLSNYGA